MRGPALQNLQEQLKQCRYVIIDEMSMIGRRQLGTIHQRLCQARPDHATEPFGGLSLVLVGDFGQLPPVGDTPLYVADSKGTLSNLGRAMYTEFTESVVLTEVMRQVGSDNAQIRFKQALLRLRNAAVTKNDWQLFMTRTIESTRVNKENLTLFDEAIRLFSTVEEVAEYNVAYLRRLGRPIAHIKAIHDCAEAKRPVKMKLGYSFECSLMRRCPCYVVLQYVDGARVSKWEHGNDCGYTVSFWWTF